MSGFESTTTIERPIPVTERDVFVIGPLRHNDYDPLNGRRESLANQFDTQLREALGDYPDGAQVASVTPTMAIDTGDVSVVYALFTVTVEWAVRP